MFRRLSDSYLGLFGAFAIDNVTNPCKFNVCVSDFELLIAVVHGGVLKSHVPCH